MIIGSPWAPVSPSPSAPSPQRCVLDRRRWNYHIPHGEQCQDKHHPNPTRRLRFHAHDPPTSQTFKRNRRERARSESRPFGQQFIRSARWAFTRGLARVRVRRMAGLTKPSEYFHSTILPAERDCAEHPLDERYANIAASAVSNQIEWVYWYYELTDASRLDGAGSLPDFRREIFERCPELKLLWDAADASKHRFLDRPSNPPRTVLSSTSAYVPIKTRLLLADQEFDTALAVAVEFWRSWPD